MRRRTICPFHFDSLQKGQTSEWTPETGNRQIESWFCIQCQEDICLLKHGIRFAYDGFYVYSDEISDFTISYSEVHAKELIKNVTTHELIQVVYTTLATEISYFKLLKSVAPQLYVTCFGPNQDLNLLNSTEMSELLVASHHWKMAPFL